MHEAPGRERCDAAARHQFQALRGLVHQAHLELLGAEELLEAGDDLALDEAQALGDVERVDDLGIERQEVRAGRIDRVDAVEDALARGDVMQHADRAGGVGLAAGVRHERRDGHFPGAVAGAEAAQVGAAVGAIAREFGEEVAAAVAEAAQGFRAEGLEPLVHPQDLAALVDHADAVADLLEEEGRVAGIEARSGLR